MHRVDPDIAGFARLGRGGLRGARRRRGPVEPATTDDTQGSDVDAAAGLDVPEEPLMFRFERLARGGGIETARGDSDPHRPLLAVVAQIHFALDRGCGPLEAVTGQRIPRPRLDLRKAGLKGGAVGPVQIDEKHLKIILPDVGLQHAQRAEGSGGARQQSATAPQGASHRGSVHRPGATCGNEREGRGIVAALDAEPFHRVQQVLLQKPDHPGRRGFDREAKRPGELVLDRLTREGAIQGFGAAGQGAGPQAPEHELGVGHGRMLATQSIGGRPWARTGSLRADVQQARVVDPGNRAAPRADGVDFDRGGGQMVAVDHERVRHRHLAARHHHDIAAGSADLHRDQIGCLTGGGAAFQGAHSRGRARQHQHHRACRHLLDGHGAAVALQQEERAR